MLLCIGLMECGKCPDVRVCQCFWDLLPKTTSCRINILGLKRGGVVQSQTENLVLHSRLEKLHVPYNINMWVNLQSLHTLDRVYLCGKGICQIDVTSTIKTSPKTVKRISSTTSTLASCFTTTTEVFRSTLKFTCSTQITVGEHLTISFPVWNIYVPLLCVLLIVIVIVIVYIVRKRQMCVNINVDNDSHDGSSISLFEIPEMSSSSPVIMETPIDYRCMRKEDKSFVAFRTRQQSQPIAHRLRSSRKDS